MIFEPCEQFERLQAVDSQFIVEIVAGLKFGAREFEMRSREIQNFIRGLFNCFHDRLLFYRKMESGGYDADNCGAPVHGRYGCGPAFSTNLRRPFITAGRVKRSQKRSISRPSSSAGK